MLIEDYEKDIEAHFGPKAPIILAYILESQEKGEKVDESLIAHALKMDVHDVRKVLYMLQNHNLVVSKFWKTNEKGWSIYCWYINSKSFEKFFSKPRENSEILPEINSDFQCPFCLSSYDYVKALENHFLCQECGSYLSSTEEMLDSTKQEGNKNYKEIKILANP